MDCTLEEFVTTALLLLFLTHFHIPIIEPVQSSLFTTASDDQTALGQWISISIWSIACVLMFRSRHVFTSGFRGIGWSVAFVSVALLSAIWSQDASLTIRKSAFLILTTFFGIYFARRYTIEQQQRMICIAGLAAALLSIAFALLLPAYGMDHDAHEGVWMGIFTQKNVCAREMLFLLASVVAYKPASVAIRRSRFVAIFAILAVILGTQSKTAWLITVAVCCVFPMLALYRRLHTGVVLLAFISALCVVFSACVLAASPLPQLLTLMGRDGTMTGRTEIWRAVLAAVAKHPLLGYGFNAFWLSLRGESANIILSLHWAVPAAHNGFLEIWLQLGALGLFIFLGGFLASLRTAFLRLRQPSYARAVWPFAVLLLTLIYNLDESSLMQPNDFLWVLYVATLSNLASPLAIERHAGDGITLLAAA